MCSVAVGGVVGLQVGIAALRFGVCCRSKHTMCCVLLLAALEECMISVGKTACVSTLQSQSLLPHVKQHCPVTSRLGGDNLSLRSRLGWLHCHLNLFESSSEGCLVKPHFLHFTHHSSILQHGSMVIIPGCLLRNRQPEHALGPTCVEPSVLQTFKSRAAACAQ